MKTCCSLKKCKKRERKRKKEVDAKALLVFTGIELLRLQNILIIISLFRHILWIWNKELFFDWEICLSASEKNLFKYLCVALV